MLQSGALWSLAVRRTGERRLEVHHRSTVNHFHGADPQAMCGDLAHRHSMQANRVRPVRRSRRKHTRQRTARVRTRMNLQYVAFGLMQPGQDNQLVANPNPVKALRREWTHFQPRVRRALRALFGRLATFLNRGSDHANRPQPQQPSTPCSCCLSPLGFPDCHLNPPASQHNFLRRRLPSRPAACTPIRFSLTPFV